MKLVITRHPAYLAYLKEINLVEGEGHQEDYQVVEHATEHDVVGLDVITSGLPFHLASLCRSVTTVPLFLTLEQRVIGRELTIEEVRATAQPPKTYVVREI